jgi:hypothetical protein
MFDAMIPEAWTNMLYKAAETVRERTALELREFQATWIGWAVYVSIMGWMKGRYGTGWIGEEKRHNSPGLPFIDLGDIDNIYIDNERKSPDLSEHRGECQLTPDFCYIGESKHGEHVKNGARNYKQVCLESVESESFQG